MKLECIQCTRHELTFYRTSHVIFSTWNFRAGSESCFSESRPSCKLYNPNISIQVKRNQSVIKFIFTDMYNFETFFSSPATKSSNQFFRFFIVEFLRFILHRFWFRLYKSQDSQKQTSSKRCNNIELRWNLKLLGIDQKFVVEKYSKCCQLLLA